MALSSWRLYTRLKVASVATGELGLNSHRTNRKVRIVQQRPLLAELLENEGDNARDTNFLEEEDRIFGWQQKVFSPFEVNFYSEETNCLTESQRLYHRQIKENDIAASQLYTFTQNDPYYSKNELLTRPYRTRLAIRNQTALPVLQNRKPFSERYKQESGLQEFM